MILHLKCHHNVDILHWRAFKRGDGEWIHKSRAPALYKELQMVGEIVISNHKYKLSKDFIVREPI
jgi:hypothetical protein